MIEISIKKMVTANTGDATDKVIAVNFDYSYTNEDITVTSNADMSFPNDAPYSTAYADLTEEQVKGWITSDAELIARLECSIRLEWNAKQQTTSQIVQNVPWASAS